MPSTYKVVLNKDNEIEFKMSEALSSAIDTEVLANQMSKGIDILQRLEIQKNDSSSIPLETLKIDADFLKKQTGSGQLLHLKDSK